MSYTEFVNAMDILNGHPHLEERLSYIDAERPIVYQIFDDNPERIFRAALAVRSRNPDIIDINMGCSAKNVAGRGAGAGLLCTPHKIAEIFSRLSRELDIPVTGKIRLGWDDTRRNYLQIAQIIEDNGGKLIAVHGRTKQQGYTGEADWDAIAEVKQSVSIPILANGDVKTPQDIERVKKHTGCDGIMIARAAIGNPWILARLERVQVPVEEVRRVILLHMQRMLEFYGPDLGLILFRKHTSRYISPYPYPSELRGKLLTSTRADEFLRLLDEILSCLPVQPVL